MTGWIVKSSGNEPDRLVHAIKDGYWVVRNPGALRGIEPEDHVFFWRTDYGDESGLQAYIIATTPLEVIDPDAGKPSWPAWNPTEFTHRFGFELVADSVHVQRSWSELRQITKQTLVAKSPVNRIKDDSKVAEICALYNRDDGRSSIDPYDRNDWTDTRTISKRATVERPGQIRFRETARRAYDTTCAVTRYKVRAVLEAAHIDPYRGADSDHVQNSLLLRSDIHRLFDAFEITIDDDYRVMLSPTLRTSAYGDLHGTPILLPTSIDHYPSSTALARHRAKCDWL